MVETQRTYCEPERIPSSPERLQRERSVAQAFIKGLQNKADHLRIHGNTPRLTLADGEHKLLKRAIYENAGLFQGFAAGVFTMLALRQGPIILGRYLQRWWNIGGPAAKSTTLGTKNSPFRPQAPIVPPNESSLMKTGWWVIDFALSCSVAAATAAATTNQEAVLLTVSQVPRLPESRVSDTFCPEAISIYKELMEQEESALLLQSPQSVILQAVVDFSRGCQQRENRKEFVTKRDAEEGVFNDEYTFGGETRDWDESRS